MNKTIIRVLMVLALMVTSVNVFSGVASAATKERLYTSCNYDNSKVYYNGVIRLYVEHGDTLEFNVSDLYREDSKDAAVDQIELYNTLNKLCQWTFDVEHNPNVTMDSYVTCMQVVNGQPLVVERTQWRYLYDDLSNLRDETICNF